MFNSDSDGDGGSDTDVYGSDSASSDYGIGFTPRGRRPPPPPSPPLAGRRNIKDIKKFGELSAATKAAYYDEAKRKMRIKSHEKELLSIFPRALDEMILDYVPTTKAVAVSVHPNIVKYMKEHQKIGVKFMWDTCFETVDRIKTDPGVGCILAHCMGLGKTLQMVALSHTLLTNDNLSVNKIMVVCPKNTVLNWCGEFDKWIRQPMKSVKVYTPGRNESDKHSEIMKWDKTGGVLVLSYNLLRITIESLPKAGKGPLYEALVDPGADVIICDEGHCLKSDKTKLAKVMLSMKSLRRIVLTGTPMQNNLLEYYCMVNFVRPHLLGTKFEFRNMFLNPIQNGQYENSWLDDVNLMKARSHVMYHTLTCCVQRFDVTTLAAFLPPKYEFVLCVRLTTTQAMLYEAYLAKDLNLDNLGSLVKRLFADYQLLQRVWTHPYSLQLYDQRPASKLRKSKKRPEESEDEDDIEFPSFYEPGWWRPLIDMDEVNAIEAGNKLVVLFEIIKSCIENKEKLLVFSGSLFSLETIEHFLLTGPLAFQPDLDFLILTGATSGIERDCLCKRFNDPINTRVKVFMISTRAGGMGITLNAANRAVIFDASWNPSHDVQSIFRIYRLGQTKPCFVYRLVASGTMEEKIYERQVAKQSTAKRVVDEKQITRHYTKNELYELYSLNATKVYDNKPAIAAKDPLLQKLVAKHSDIIGGYHEHDSLLKHKLEEELLEIEKKGAWSDFRGGAGDFIEEDRTLVNLITPETIKQGNLKIVMRRKYPHLSEQALSTLVTDLMPRVKEMTSGLNFKSLMLEEAIDKRKKEEMEKEAAGQMKRGAFGAAGAGKPKPLRVRGMMGGIAYGNMTDSEPESD